MRSFTSISGLGLALVLAMNTASAQVNANMTATATVGASLGVSAAPGVLGQLRFGTLAQGTGATTVLPSAATAGRFDVIGIGSSVLDVSFTALPASLNGPGGASLTMTSYQACYTTTTTNAGCTAQAISTAAPMSGSPALSAGGVGYVWIGSTLGAIAAGQNVGTYTGTVTVQIVIL